MADSIIPPKEYTAQGEKIRHMDTAEAYDRWAEVYDTDGNFLQALDTIEMQTLLPELLSRIKSTSPLKVVDLGCGTGRNTIQLINLLLNGPDFSTKDISVVGLDVSRGMLDVARTRLNEVLPTSTTTIKTHLETYNLLTQPTPPPSSQNSTAIISTLVLEHIPLQPFFAAASSMLSRQQDTYLLLTNMHSDMGAISQAGFVDPVSGEKIRPTSYAHKVRDVVEAARGEGFEVLGEVVERRVDEGLAPRLGKRAGKWVGVVVWFGVCFVRRKVE
ncbi:hypothetical protein FQN54_009027 [Arachnomyces sp. PD_36]|nr:hypothetical protein FQN54_009027 [Arachnomyces sp. PD_36]